ncbi:hypothetical protein FD514_07720 [Cutibacterium acnes]|nr:hypothetical protein FD514_07720 [Cutibacterium acnes]
MSRRVPLVSGDRGRYAGGSSCPRSGPFPGLPFLPIHKNVGTGTVDAETVPTRRHGDKNHSAALG